MTKFSLEPFAAACGFPGTFQVRATLAGESGGAPKSISLPYALIGQDELAHLRFIGPAVARRHLYIQWVEGWPFWVNLSRQHQGPETRTETESGWLALGRDTPIPPFSIQVSSGQVDRTDVPRDGAPPAANWDPLATGVPDPDAYPDVVLDFYKGAEWKITWRMDRVMALLGSSSPCRIRLRDAEISSYHASLVRTPQGLWAVDLLGKGGIWVDDRRVRWARLDDEAQLRVGPFTLRVRCPADHRSSPALARSLVPVRDRRVGVADEALRPASHFAPVIPVLPGPLPAPVLPGPHGARGEPGSALGGTDAVVASLVHHFGALQQQMFDQFQETIVMMVEMFSTLQKDQLGLVRQEINRLQELTQELNMLQAELAKAPAPTTPQEAQTHSAPQPNFARPKGPAADNGGPEAESTTPEPGPTPAVDFRPPPSPEESAGSASKEKIHLWLYERIEAIQKERQSRWQKLMQTLRVK